MSMTTKIEICNNYKGLPVRVESQLFLSRLVYP